MKENSAWWVRYEIDLQKLYIRSLQDIKGRPGKATPPARMPVGGGQVAAQVTWRGPCGGSCRKLQAARDSRRSPEMGPLGGSDGDVCGGLGAGCTHAVPFKLLVQSCPEECAGTQRNTHQPSPYRDSSRRQPGPREPLLSSLARHTGAFNTCHYPVVKLLKNTYFCKIMCFCMWSSANIHFLREESSVDRD